MICNQLFFNAFFYVFLGELLFFMQSMWGRINSQKEIICIRIFYRISHIIYMTNTTFTPYSHDFCVFSYMWYWLFLMIIEHMKVAAHDLISWSHSCENWLCTWFHIICFSLWFLLFTLFFYSWAESYEFILFK